MTRLRSVVFVLLAVGGGAILVSNAAPQAQAPPTAAGGARWTPPRTPWGDPDLQGVYFNDNEYATPLERPAEFAGKTLADVTAADMEKVRASAEQRMIAGLAPGPRGPDDWWLQNLDLTKRSQPWLIVDPPDGRIPPLVPGAKPQPARGSFAGGPFNSVADFSLLDRCISRSIPGSMIPVMYGNVYDILQAPGYVAITYEIVHEARVIPLDRRPHLGAAIRQHMGDSRGWWEGNTLVVETTNFTAAAAYRGANPAALRVTERFMPVAPDTIAWTATIEDATTWTRPWTIRIPLRQYPFRSLPFECHEGNYGLRNILSAARAAERTQ